MFKATIDLLKNIVRYEFRRSAASGVALELEKRSYKTYSYISMYLYIYVRFVWRLSLYMY